MDWMDGTRMDRRLRVGVEGDVGVDVETVMVTVMISWSSCIAFVACVAILGCHVREKVITLVDVYRDMFASRLSTEANRDSGQPVMMQGRSYSRDWWSAAGSTEY